ncbi:glycoside hydrolase family 32 protein [Nocardiopsis halotolerans]|uniref:glycoside hydrolase family 32 protein n=1 Tax=Nocardiopsis halotolerans TaxID=124252 RepID=UPI00034D2119|nr:glycoside hydrolase family 32 protein [Nocardiopsis halotolerans]
MTADRRRPQLHVRPAAGQWCNDPNGPLFHDGRYHLFFQHNPAAPVWGDIHWGHASSPDLLTWDDHGIALTPTPGTRDALGAWSGCAVVEDGVPTAVYTGMDRSDGVGSVMLARAVDEEVSQLKADPDPVVPGPPPGLDLAAFRDPYLFTVGDRRWALMGAGHRDSRPDVLLYRVHSLTEWTYEGSLLDAADPVASRVAGPAAAWECPALFPEDPSRTGAGDRWVLVLSLWADDVTYLTVRLVGALLPTGDGPRTGTDGAPPDGGGARSGGGGLRFVPEDGGLLDHGRDFYAATALVRRDRTLLWGWSWESRTEEESVAEGWAGCLTHPREVGPHPDGGLRVAPARELSALRTRELACADPLPPAYEVALDAEVDLPDTEVVLRLGDTVALRVNPSRGLLVLDRAGAPATGTHPLPRADEAVATGPSDTRARLRVLVDGPIVEVFWNDRVTLTEKVHPAPHGSWSAATVRGAARVEVRAWECGPPRGPAGTGTEGPASDRPATRG